MCIKKVKCCLIIRACYTYHYVLKKTPTQSSAMPGKPKKISVLLLGLLAKIKV